VSLIVDEHRSLLSDRARLDALSRAIDETVHPGAVVLDLASGTGVLGVLACKAGASRVYAIELSGMSEIGRAVAAANGCSGRITVVHSLSSHIALPEPVDVIVCDQIGRFGVEAGLIAYGSDARDRFLKPGGAFVPGAFTLHVAPVEVPSLYEQIDFWNSRPAGVDFSPARTWAANTGYPTWLSKSELLAPGCAAPLCDMSTVRPGPLAFRHEVSIERRGVLHGIGGWFSAQLSPSVSMSNAPDASDRIDRRNVFFPIDEALNVEPGDIVTIGMRIIPPDTIAWTVEVRRGDTRLGVFRHSTINGMLLAREDLRRMNPGFAPALTDRGEARRSVLELCDGRRTLAEIETQVYERHPAIFRSRDEAAAFVAEVVTGYSR
jgi:protein arginine N-methyltransferase 1